MATADIVVEIWYKKNFFDGYALRRRLYEREVIGSNLVVWHSKWRIEGLRNRLGKLARKG